jgi:hypothetical protein
VPFRYCVRRDGSGWSVVEVSRVGRVTEQRTMIICYDNDDRAARNEARRHARTCERRLRERMTWSPPWL